MKTTMTNTWDCNENNFDEYLDCNENNYDEYLGL